MYRDRHLEDELRGSEEVLVVVYAAEGFALESMLFHASSDTTSWFSSDNFKSSTSWEFTLKNFGGIDSEWNGREEYLAIIDPMNSCEKFKAYLFVKCPTVSCRIGCEDYYDVEREQICVIAYTKKHTPTNFHTDGHLIASAIEIYVRKND